MGPLASAGGLDSPNAQVVAQGFCPNVIPGTRPKGSNYTVAFGGNPVFRCATPPACQFLQSIDTPGQILLNYKSKMFSTLTQVKF